MSPFAKQLWDIAAPSPAPLQDLTEEQAYHFGHLWRFSDKPVTLPIAPPEEIQRELDALGRIQNHPYRGTPGEL